MESVQNGTVQENRRSQELLMQLLEAEQCACVIRNGDTVRLFRRRGVRDLFELLHEEPALLAGAFVADKVVGKGAAALMILGGVRELQAGAISEAALALFAQSAVQVHCPTVVPHIADRAGTGVCPVETLCRDCRTAEECLPRIAAFLDEMAKKG